MEPVKGTDIESLRKAIRDEKVKLQDVLVLTYSDGASLEVLYNGFLRGANDAPREIRIKHTIGRNVAINDFVSWERKGTYGELYKA